MLKIGLTGAIGSGKSTIADFFTELGASVIDADEIAKDLVKPNTQAFQAIIKHFGVKILLKNRALNRTQLRKIIFHENKEKMWLENLLHPLIYQKMQLEIKKVSTKYCILVIPLLIETKKFDFVDRILVVDTNTDLLIARAKQRDLAADEEIKAILTKQASQQQRLQVADDIITNNASLSELKQQVLVLHQKYLQIAG